MFENIFKRKINNEEKKSTPTNVGEFYNTQTDNFLKVYGEIIQAFRTNNVEDYLNYTASNARIAPGMKLIDAGCGVCGPAIHFAKSVSNLHIEACTISSVQAQMSKDRIQANGLNDRIHVREADYHSLIELYPNTEFDRVYFLESFGHSDNKTKLIHAVWDVLKPGGMLYIKDLFRRESDNEWEQLKINQICEQINKAYCYHIADLTEIISILRRKGYILHFIKVPEIERSVFENLTISNDFQNLFNIGKIDSWDEYVFPIDFYEILAEKPVQHSMEDIHLYFMNKK